MEVLGTGPEETLVAGDAEAGFIPARSPGIRHVQVTHTRKTQLFGEYVAKEICEVLHVAGILNTQFADEETSAFQE